MAKKSSGMTHRQRQSQKIMREKAAKKKRRAVIRKIQIVGGGIFFVTVAGGGLWAWKSGTVERTAQAIVDEAYELTAEAGFSVEALYLEGRNRTPMSDIDEALGIKQGDPILQLSLTEVRQRLEKVNSIRFAAVERSLPGTLYIRIVEREPVALWQYQGKVMLVDDNGVVMSDIDSAPYRHLPLIIGKDAPKHVTELLTILSSEPELAQHFAAAIFVGERRWNIRLKEGIEIRLPEEGAFDAWKKLAELETKQQLLERNVKVIDLRLEGRLFIKLGPQDLPGKVSGAKET